MKSNFFTPQELNGVFSAHLEFGGGYGFVPDDSTDEPANDNDNVANDNEQDDDEQVVNG